jgi:mRNA-degrading endonuclease YafQ of YafQ-DinJ toxin-antitoxin module
MRIDVSKKFISIFDKRFRSNKSLQKKFKERTRMFEVNPANPLLHDHPLKGTKEGYRAFSITGDIRVMYIIDHDTAYFLDIGTHNQIY